QGLRAVRLERSPALRASLAPALPASRAQPGPPETMAALGLVADIHGNRQALAAVLAELERHAPDRILCLGDIVGYNADPDACASMLRGRGVLAIAGNHDLIALGELDFVRCSSKARYSLERTRQRLSAPTRVYLAGLPRTPAGCGSIVLIHGGVRDVREYM